MYNLHPFSPEMNDKMPNAGKMTPNTAQVAGKSDLAIDCGLPVQQFNVGEEETSEILDRVDLSKELRPLLVSLSLTGLYHPPSDPAKSWPVRLLNWRRLYCFSINVVMWLNVFRVAFPFITGSMSSSQFSPSIAVIICWNLQSAVSASIWFYLCSSSLQPFTALITHLQQLFGSASETTAETTAFSSISRRSVRRGVITCVVLPFVASSSTTCLYTLLATSSIEMIRNETAFLLIPFGQAGAVPLAIATFFVESVGCYATGIFCFVCWIITKQFESLNSTLKSRISSDGKLKGSLASIREQHQRITRVVLRADTVFSFFLAFMMATLLFTLSFMLYQVVIAGGNLSEASLAAFSWWLVVNAVITGILCWYASVLHGQAHDAVNYLHEISQWQERDDQITVQLTLFLAKLNGAPIALTTWSFLPVTKDFVLTVIGALFTYFVIVAQTLPMSHQQQT